MRLEEMAREFDVPSSKRKRQNSESTTSGNSSKKLLSSTTTTETKKSLSASQEDIQSLMNITEESPVEESELLDEPREFQCVILIGEESKAYVYKRDWRRIFTSDSIHDVFYKMKEWNEYWYEDAKKTFSK